MACEKKCKKAKNTVRGMGGQQIWETGEKVKAVIRRLSAAPPDEFDFAVVDYMPSGIMEKIKLFQRELQEIAMRLPQEEYLVSEPATKKTGAFFNLKTWKKKEVAKLARRIIPQKLHSRIDGVAQLPEDENMYCVRVWVPDEPAPYLVFVDTLDAEKTNKLTFVAIAHINRSGQIVLVNDWERGIPLAKVLEENNAFIR